MYLFSAPSRKLKDGTYPVVLQVSHNRTRKYFPTKYYCTPEQWDVTARRLTRQFAGYKDANKDLTAQEAKAQKIIERMAFDEVLFDFGLFSQQYTGKTDSRNLVDYFTDHIKRLKIEGKAGTAAPYEQTLNNILRFKPGAKNMLLHGVTYSFVIEFEHWLRVDRKLQDTSISVYMRALRTLLNRAIKEQILKREQYPFDKYLISELKTETQKRSIPKSVVKAIEALSFPDAPRLQLAKDIFIFSYYNRGMNFADIAYLTGKNIEADALRYIRKKTGRSFAIALRDETRQIIERYTSQADPNAGGYIFPVFDDRIHKTDQQRYDRRKTALRAVNRALKEIAAMVGYKDLELTTYTARHTYAQVLKQAGTSTGKISEAMGHSSEKVTDIYLKSFGDDTLNQIDKDAL